MVSLVAQTCSGATCERMVAMAQEYPFVVNAGSVVAVYTQIENQVRFGIASGALPYQATKRR